MFLGQTINIYRYNLQIIKFDYFNTPNKSNVSGVDTKCNYYYYYKNILKWFKNKYTNMMCLLHNN